MGGMTITSDTHSMTLSGEEWLWAQATRGWEKAGLSQLDDWDRAVMAAARIVAYSAAPMALMLGKRGTLLANPGAEKLFFDRVGICNGHSVIDMLPDAAPFYSAMLKQVFAGKALSFVGEPVRMPRGGTMRTCWFNLEFTPIVDEAGEIVGALGIASDVSEMKRKLRDVENSEQRMRVALESAGMVGLWMLDLARDLTFVDHNVARMYGMGDVDLADGIPDAQFIAAVHPDDRQRVSEALAAAIANVRPYRCRYRLVSSDARIRWVIASAKPVCDDDGTVEQLLGVVIEVTDQVETASALAESRFQFQTLTEALPQIVWSSDGEGRHDYFSQRWSEFTGISQGDITQETWKMLVYPAHHEIVQVRWQWSLDTGEPYDLDYRFRHHSGEYRWLRVMALPIRDADGRITRWFGTSTDVHDSYLLAEERDAFAEELERIATIDQLTGTLTRRAFMDRATRHLAERPAGEDAALLMLDIDHFKAINDRYGHPAGDRVLAETVACVKSVLRTHDFIGRLGGEEFAIFLPACPEDVALKIAERICSTVEASPVTLEDGPTLSVTLCLGVAGGHARMVALKDLLSTADKALYAAKAAGRNRTALG